MTKEFNKDDMRRFARLGAMKRLEDIRREEASIRAAFPELFAAARRAPGEPSRKKAPSGGQTRKARKRVAPPKRSPMSAAMRKVVSERMKKYWAGRRKAKNG